MNKTCVGCGQNDDHPRHVTVDRFTGDEIPWHMDCHAHVGCEVCISQIEGSNGAKGENLRQHIVSKAGAAQ